MFPSPTYNDAMRRDTLHLSDNGSATSTYDLAHHTIAARATQPYVTRARVHMYCTVHVP